MGFKAQTCWTELLAFLGCLKPIQNSYFRSRPAIFRFSGALACSSLAPCTSVVRVFFQALEPTAFLVHPVLAAIAEDAVAAHYKLNEINRNG